MTNTTIDPMPNTSSLIQFTEDERQHLLLALSFIESDLPEHHSLLKKLVGADGVHRKAGEE